MKEWNAADYKSVDEATDAALAALDREHRKLLDVTTAINEASTTVKSKDRSISMDFDGRGEITGITFHGSKYRSMAPAELSHVLLETIRAGRDECMQKMAAAMGGELLPGINFADMAAGKVDAEEVFQKLVSPFLGDDLGDGILGRPAKDSKGDGRNG
jgi:hypothetical protein